MLVARCTSPRPVGPARWFLYLTDESHRRPAAKADLGSILPHPASVDGSLRVVEGVLPGEPVLEVLRQESGEGDGGVQRTELWRWSVSNLERILELEGGWGGGPGNTGVSWRWGPLKAEEGVARIEVVLGMGFSDDPVPPKDSYGELRVIYRFDGTRFRAPTGQPRSADSSTWLPPSQVADYLPLRAIDGRLETAWCIDGKSLGAWPSIIISPSDPDPVIGVKLVAGYAKSERSFLDNARVARIRIRGGDSKPIETDLADTMEPQVVPYRAKTDRVQITILKVRPGRRSSDICISEILLEQAAPSGRRPPE